MPQPETPTARATADDIPTSVTQLVYTAPPIDENHNGKPLHLSQNKTAELLAHYWPAIEAHFRGQIAVEQRAFHAEQNRSIPCAGPGCLVHEVINHIAVSAPGGE